MSLGLAWGSRLLLTMLATAAVVIAHHQRHRGYSHMYFHDEASHKLSNNISRLYEDLRTGTYQQQLGGPLRVPHLRHHHVAHRGPYFENAEGQEISRLHKVAHLGDTALLDCRVAMLFEKTVMWVRQSPDQTLLTIGNVTHIEDPRYSVRFKYPNNWRLAISSVQKEDCGLYVCQVNTHPPKMLVTNVTILAPDIRIMDEASNELRDRYYKTGSIIELSCIARPSRPSSKVPHPVWKKNGETLPDHVNVYHTNGTDNELLTMLRIEHAKKSDSGEFTCTIGQFSTAVVHIHVLNGEKQAAVHHDQWNGASGSSSQPLSVLFAGFLLLRSSIGYLL